MSCRAPLLVAGVAFLVCGATSPEVEAAPGSDPQPACAIVCQLSGRAYASSSDSSEPLPIKLLDRFATGTIVATDPGSLVQIAMVSGQRFEVLERSIAKIEEDCVVAVQGEVHHLPPVPTTLTLAPIAPGEPVGRPAVSRIRSDRSNASSLRLDPGNGGVVLADQAVLRFSQAAGALRYRIKVEDRFEKPLLVLETEQDQVEVARGVLKPGEHDYHWSVQALKETGPAERAGAVFSTLSQAVADEREQLVALIERDPDPNLLLLLAAVGAEQGSVAEAMQLLECDSSDS